MNLYFNNLVLLIDDLVKNIKNKYKLNNWYLLNLNFFI